MKKIKQVKDGVTISVIGVRGFPAEFIGTSGLEVYVEKTVGELLKLNPSLQFLIYTRKQYQPETLALPERVKIKPLVTLSSKVMESVIYSFIASILCVFDQSRIVWYHGVGPGFFFFIPRLFGKKVFLTVHSLDWERKKWNAIERFLFRRGAYFVFSLRPNAFTVSKELKSFLLRKFGLKTIYAPPGIDVYKDEPDASYLEHYALEKNEYLLFLGRLVPEKRIEWLIEEYLKLKDKFPNLRLVIAGGHGNLPEYERELKEKYKDRGIVWAGYVFGEEKLALVKYCRCFVLPSELEGNPISFMEALGMGKICVVSNEVADKFKNFSNVFSFRKDKRSSFEDALWNALAAPRRYRYSKSEVKQIKNFSWRETSRDYLQKF